ncbi:MAG: toprim domain-containing protein [Peptococcaceae bacterium]|nr:toprim domain-containing protein [Peptococcaceae bacterium]
MPKVIIVEGKTDREHVLRVLAEPVEIVCTFGTLSDSKIEQLIVPLQMREVFILVDADRAGNKLRRQLREELPNAKHLYTRMMYRGVASTPLDFLAKILSEAHFVINEQCLQN